VDIYISIDMEGVTGVVLEADVTPGTPQWELARHWMTADANAAIDGAVAGGAERILVDDGHWTMCNLIADELRPEADLVRGSVKSLGMMEGIDRGWDAALFVGYHAGFGAADGVLGHTLSGERFRRIRLNGEEVTEAEINAAVAGAFGVPVAMVSGDAALQRHLADRLPEAEFAVVKTGVSAETAVLVHPVRARERIRQCAQRAVARTASIPPFVVDLPCEVHVEFQHPAGASIAEWVPNVERVDEVSVRFLAGDAPAIMRMLNLLMRLQG
jgi:D-amino peptidase